MWFKRVEGVGCRVQGGIDGHLVQLPENRVLGRLLSPTRFSLTRPLFVVLWDLLDCLVGYLVFFLEYIGIH